MQAPLPANEQERLKALKSFGIMDTAPERGFDDIVRIASHLCGTPISLLSLVDDRRQWFKAKVGLDASETPREQAFCAHAILKDEVLEVRDATADERFADNPLVTAPPNIRFYAGAPLETGAGHRLGTLCVIDRKPRELSPEQEGYLRALGRLATFLIEARSLGEQLRLSNQSAQAALRLVAVCAWCRKPRAEAEYREAMKSFLDTLSEKESALTMCAQCRSEMKLS